MVISKIIIRMLGGLIKEATTFKCYGLTPRVIQDLRKRSIAGIVFYVMVLCVVLFTDRYYMRHPEFSSQFLFLISAISLFRWFHLMVLKWKPGWLEKLNNMVFIASMALTGLIWGVGLAKFMMQPEEIEAKLLMLICTVGLCSGGVVAFIPYLRLSLAYNCCIIGPAVFIMGFYQQNWPLFSCFVLFLIYMSVVAVRGNREYWIALENEHLLEEKTKDLEKLSRTDSLTGLYNRRRFEEMLSMEWAHAVRHRTPVCVLLCDIDFFKRINDRYGHQAGDEYLKGIGALLKQRFKRKTDITARYGGAEFIILILNETKENACLLAEKLRSDIQHFHLLYKGLQIRTTLSFGLASLVPTKSDTPEKIISKADKALYRSKSEGRNRITLAQ